MIEMIKLANHYNLNSMVKATESFFQDQMIALMDSNSTCLTIKSQIHNFSKKRHNQVASIENIPKSNDNSQQLGRGQQSRGAGAP